MDIRIGLLGCGTVGAGVIDLMRKRSNKISDMTGMRPSITRVLVRDLTKERGIDLDGAMLTTNPDDILSDPDIRIVIETIGGIEPARSYILTALKAGKHVITANKDLIALHGSEIIETADAAGVDILYEAAVGGAIPLIRPLKESLTANDITDLLGIINGTTNYILTQMTETGADFSEALKEAQDLGYAEADPTSDVDGLDAARKLTILATIGFHAKVNLSEVEVSGIRSVTAADVKYASEIGCVIKLLASGTDRNGILSLRVSPTLVPKQHPLAGVSGSYNALFVRGDASGDLMFFGRGAGSLPTASSVVGDVIEALRNMRLNVSGRVSQMVMPHKTVDPDGGSALRHYLRMSVVDQPGVFAKIAGLCGDEGLSMETVLQKRASKGTAEVVIVTHEVKPEVIRRVVEAFRQMPSIKSIDCVMPVQPMTE